MLHKTRGIVFRFVRYGETSIIVSIFTEQFGIQSYIVNGVRSRSAKSKIALYQPLTLLDLVVYHKENGNIMRIKEVQCAYFYKTLSTDIRKSPIAMFLTEVINRTVKEQSHPEEVFTFLYNSFTKLDQLESHFENFHLFFLLQLGRHLGFGVERPEEIFYHRAIPHTEMKFLEKLVDGNYDERINITHDQRRLFLDVIIYYYQQHIDNLGDFKSIQVLREVLM